MSTYPNPGDLPRDALEEHDYLLRRAAEHRRLAERSDEPGPIAIHLQLERLYQERAGRLAVVLPD